MAPAPTHTHSKLEPGPTTKCVAYLFALAPANAEHWGQHVRRVPKCKAAILEKYIFKILAHILANGNKRCQVQQLRGAGPRKMQKTQEFVVVGVVVAAAAAVANAIVVARWLLA